MAKEPGKEDRTGPPRGFAEFRHKLTEDGRLRPSPRPEREQKAPVYTRPDRPNILWIMVDQLRADTLGFMGHPLIKTPHLDRLAAGGAHFANAYCTSPVCSPSRSSSLTGHYLVQHGVIQNGYRMDPGVTTFPTWLAEAGYRTACIGKSHLGRPASEVWQENVPVEDVFGATKPSKVAFDPSLYPGVKFIGDEVCDDSDRVLYGSYPGPVKMTKSYLTANEAMKWLYWNDDPRPFFLRVCFDDPHPPVVPPKPFHGMYDPEDLPADLFEGAAESMSTKPRVIQEYWRFSLQDKITPEDHRLHAACYLALVSHLDAQIGRILDYLDELGWTDDTIVLFTSDHGHHIGEHNRVHKGVSLYEGVSHVPMIVRWPGRIAPGTRVDALFDGVDFLPTVMDIADVAIPPEAAAILPGTSALPLLDGRDGPVRDRLFLQWEDYGFGVREGDWKLMWWDPDNEAELYNLKDDPLEKKNLALEPSFREQRDRLLATLGEWRSKYAPSLDFRTAGAP